MFSNLPKTIFSHIYLVVCKCFQFGQFKILSFGKESDINFIYMDITVKGPKPDMSPCVTFHYSDTERKSKDEEHTEVSEKQ